VNEPGAPCGAAGVVKWEPAAETLSGPARTRGAVEGFSRTGRPEAFCALPHL